MFCDLVCLGLIERDLTARQRDKGEFVLSQKLLEFGGLEVCDRVRPKLNARISSGGNIVHRLALFVAPGNGSIAETDAGQAAYRRKRRQSRHSTGCTKTNEKGSTRGVQIHKGTVPVLSIDRDLPTNHRIDHLVVRGRRRWRC